MAIVGVGNCANSLVQGIQYYRDNSGPEISGLMHPSIGGFKPGVLERSRNIASNMTGRLPECGGEWSISHNRSDTRNNDRNRRNQVCGELPEPRCGARIFQLRSRRTAGRLGKGALFVVRTRDD